MSVQDPVGPDQVSALFSRLDQLRRAERRAASARVASVIGHLIGTPLNVIAGRAALIRTNQTTEAIIENVRRIEDQVERLAERIRRLIDYLSVADPPVEARAVSDVLREALALYGPIAEGKGITLTTSCNGAAQASIDNQPALLVLTSLLSLAARTTQVGDAVALLVAEHTPKTVLFELLLPGLETPPSRVDRLEPPDQGTGYDADAMQVLSICLGIARRNGGGLEVVAAPSGTGVLIRFECARA